MPKLRVSDSEESKPKRVLHKTSSAEERDTQTEDEMSSAERGPLDETSMQDPGTPLQCETPKRLSSTPKGNLPEAGQGAEPDSAPSFHAHGVSMQREREIRFTLGLLWVHYVQGVRGNVESVVLQVADIVHCAF